MPAASSRPPSPSRWRAPRRAFLRALAALLGAGALPAVSAAGGQGRWSAWTAALALADGYWTSPPHEARHPFNALGVLWADGAPPAGVSLEARASPDGVAWTAWHALPLDGDAGGRAHSTLLFVPTSRVAQYRLSAPAPPPRLALLDTTDGPTATELGADVRDARPLGLAGAAALQQAVPRPPIVSRSSWGAQESYRWWVPEYRVTDHLAIHHTGAAASRADPAAAVRSVYYYHTVVLDWGDIGYHYLIDWAGTVYEGRYGGPNVVGGHIKGHNPGVEGIAALGNYDGAWPSDSLEQALVDLLAWRAESLGIDPQGLTELGDGLVPNILGHRDAAQTSCPGLRLYIDLGNVRAQTRLRIGFVPRIGAELVTVRAATDTVEVGERVAFTFAVRNSGTIPLAPAGPPPGLGYVEGAGATARGLGVLPAAVQLGLGTVEEIEAARVAAAQAASGTGLHEAAGEDAPDPTRTPRAPLPPAYPYRWGLDRALLPGESVTVRGHLRLRGPGGRRLAAAVLREAGDPLAEGQPAIAVRVVPALPALRIATPTVATNLAFPWLGDTTGGWESRLTLTSAGSGPAALRWTLLAGRGAATPPTSATVPAYGSARWDYSTDNGTAPGIGAPSAALAAGGPAATGPGVLGALAEAPLGLAGVLHVRPADEPIGPGPSGAVAYPGQQGGGSQLWVPLLADVPPAGVSWETRVVLQNLGEQTARVRATWLLQGNETRSEERVVEAGLSTSIAVPPGARGGLVDSLGGQPLAGVAVATAPSGMATAYLLPTGGSGRLLLPVFGAASGWASAVTVMNAGDTLAEVRLRSGAYGGGLGTAERVSLPPRGVARLLHEGAPSAPAGAFGAADLTVDSGAVAAVAQLVRLDGTAALAYRPTAEPSGELALPLADLGGLPEHRRVVVQSVGGGPRVTLRYYDADGQELDRSVDTLGEDGARVYPVREAAVDSASIHVRSEGAPVVAALLQIP